MPYQHALDVDVDHLVPLIDLQVTQEGDQQDTRIVDKNTPASRDDRAEVRRLAAAIQDTTDESIELAYVEQGYTGEKPAGAARAQGITLEVVRLPEAKRGFVLLPRRWVVERSFAWATRCRRLVKDYERYASTLASLHVIAFACFMLRNAAMHDGNGLGLSMVKAIVHLHRGTIVLSDDNPGVRCIVKLPIDL